VFTQSEQIFASTPVAAKHEPPPFPPFALASATALAIAFTEAKAIASDQVLTPAVAVPATHDQCFLHADSWAHDKAQSAN
jgi:hypothetical protein